MKFNVVRSPIGLHHWFVVLPSGEPFVSPIGYHSREQASEVASRVYRYEYDDTLRWEERYVKAF